MRRAAIDDRVREAVGQALIEILNARFPQLSFDLEPDSAPGQVVSLTPPSDSRPS